MQTPTQLGRYRIEAELGRGAMGVVYKAFDPLVERTLAIKTIRLDMDDPEGLARRLRREAKSVGQLEHPNIVTLYDVGECQGTFYLAMQYLAGESLWVRMRRQPRLSLKEVQEILRQISSALDYAHRQGVVHRDVKPANIIITPENVVKLTDFGIAKLLEGGTLSSGLIVGTPSYMSPEQALGQPLDGRSDLFSLGAILYELLTGEKAFPGENATTVIYKIIHETPTPITALRPNLCSALEPIVKKSLAKNPDERFQTSRDFQLQLDSALGSRAPVQQAMESLLPQLGAEDRNSSSTGVMSEEVPTADSVRELCSGAAEPPKALLAPRCRRFKHSRMSFIGAACLTLPLLVALRFKLVKTEGSPSLRPSVTPRGANGREAAHSEAPAAWHPGQGNHPDGPALPVTSGGRLEVPMVNSTTPESPLLHSRQRAEGKKTAVAMEATPAAGSFDSWLVGGDLAFQGSRYDRALVAYLKAYAIRRNDAGVRRKIATTLTLLGRPEEAQRYQ